MELVEPLELVLKEDVITELRVPVGKVGWEHPGLTCSWKKSNGNIWTEYLINSLSAQKPRDLLVFHFMDFFAESREPIGWKNTNNYNLMNIYKYYIINIY